MPTNRARLMPSALVIRRFMPLMMSSPSRSCNSSGRSPMFARIVVLLELANRHQWPLELRARLAGRAPEARPAACNRAHPRTRAGRGGGLLHRHRAARQGACGAGRKGLSWVMNYAVGVCAHCAVSLLNCAMPLGETGCRDEDSAGLKCSTSPSYSPDVSPIERCWSNWFSRRTENLCILRARRSLPK
jgi:hypothetical protein